MEVATLLFFIGFVVFYIIFFIAIILNVNSTITIHYFKKNLITAIKNETINDIKDVEILFNGAKNINDSNSKQPLNKLFKKLIYEKTFDLEKGNHDKEEAKKIISTLKKLLNENENQSPFSELPIQERMLFDDLNNYLNYNDMEASKVKVNEISTLFVILNDKKLKSDRLTKLSFGLAIASTAITIFTIFI